MLKIHYHPISFPALCAVFAAEATGCEYESVVVDLVTGANKTDAYLAINPFGRVPALQDGDFTLGESAAMMRYMAKREGSSLYAGGAKREAEIDQWMDFIVNHIRTNVARVQFNRVIAPMIGSDVDEGSIKLGLEFLENNLPHIERQLTEHAFLCGAEMTLADVMLVGSLEPVKMANIDISVYPNLEKWLTARRSEPFYTNVHTHFGAEMGL